MRVALGVALSLKKSFLFVFLAKMAGIFLAVAVSSILAKRLGVQGFGDYAFYWSLATIFSMFVCTGLPVLATKNLSSGVKITNQKNMIYCADALLIISCLAIASAPLVLILVSNYSEMNFYQDWRIAFIVFAMIFLASLERFLAGVFRGLHKPAFSIVVDRVFRPGVTVVLIVAVATSDIKIIDALELILVAQALGLLVSFWCYFQNSQSVLTYNFSINRIFGLLLVSIPFLGVNLIQNSANGFDILLLSYISTSEQTAYFRVGAQLSVAGGFFLSIINTMVAPKIAKAFNDNMIDDVVSLVHMTALISTIFAVIAIVVFIIFGQNIVLFLFDDKFVDSLLVLYILLISQLVNSLFGCVGIVMNMSGMQKMAFRILAIGFVINIVLDIFLIPFWGACGAAVSYLVSVVFWNYSMYRAVLNRHGFSSIPIIGVSK